MDLNEDLRTWLLRSTLEAEAVEAMEHGAVLLSKAKSLGKRKWDTAFTLNNQALSSYQHAVNLLPDSPKANKGRGEALDAYKTAALGSGDIFLARMLSRGESPDIGVVATSGLNKEPTTDRRLQQAVKNSDTTKTAEERHTRSTTLSGWLNEGYRLLKDKVIGRRR